MKKVFTGVNIYDKGVDRGIYDKGVYRGIHDKGVYRGIYMIKGFTGV